MGKDDWRRPEARGATLAPRQMEAMPATCRNVTGPPSYRECAGPVDRLARSVGEPGTVAGRCRQCGQVYIAPEEAL